MGPLFALVAGCCGGEGRSSLHETTLEQPEEDRADFLASCLGLEASADTEPTRLGPLEKRKLTEKYFPLFGADRRRRTDQRGVMGGSEAVEQRRN